MDPPEPVYENLYRLVKDKDYFVLTTNVDHCFQKAGFDKRRLFIHRAITASFSAAGRATRKLMRMGIQSAGWCWPRVCGRSGRGLETAEGRRPEMTIPSELIPHCPKCGAPMRMNLRADETFVQDAGWHQAAGRYERL